MQEEILQDIKEDPTPSRRLNLYFLITAVSVLFSLVMFFINADQSEQKIDKTDVRNIRDSIIATKNAQIIYLQKKLDDALQKLENCKDDQVHQSEQRAEDYRIQLKEQDSIRRQIKTLNTE